MGAGETPAAENYEDAHLRSANMDLKMILQTEGEKMEPKEDRIKEIDQEMGKEGKTEAEKAELKSERATLERELAEIDQKADAKKEDVKVNLKERREKFDDPIQEQTKLAQEGAALKGKLAEVQTKIAGLKAEDKGKEPELALLKEQESLTKEIAENEKDLARVTKHIEQKKLTEKNTAYHAMEAKAADAKLAMDLNDFNDRQAGKPKENTEGEKEAEKEKDKPAKEEAVPAEGDKTVKGPSEKGSWADKMGFIAGNLAKQLAKDPPNPDHMVEKFMYKVKVGGLQLAMVFGAGTDWIGELDENQKMMLEKTAGMKVTEEETPNPDYAIDQGAPETLKKYTVKWEKPDEAFRAPEGGLFIVMKDVYGEEWANSPLAQNGFEETTFAAFKDQVSKMDDGAIKTKSQDLIARMEGQSVKAEDNDNVLKFVDDKWRTLQNEPEAAAA